MANRNIDTEMWNDSKFADEFSPEDKYFWLMLLTTRYGNLVGCFSFTTLQMSKDSGYDENSIKIILNRFITKYKVVDYDFETREILIFNWYKYNWTKSPKFQIVITKYIAKIKSQRFKEYVEKAYQAYRIDTVSIPYRYPTASESISNSISNSISDSNGREGEKGLVEPTPTQVNCEKRAYGQFKNVRLTDDQYDELQKNYPSLYQEYIDRLDRYIGKSGRKFNDHYITIDSWIIEDNKKNKSNITTQNDDSDLSGIISENKKQSKAEEITDEEYAKLLSDLKRVSGEEVNTYDNRTS